MIWNYALRLYYAKKELLTSWRVLWSEGERTWETLGFHYNSFICHIRKQDSEQAKVPMLCLAGKELRIPSITLPLQSTNLFPRLFNAPWAKGYGTNPFWTSVCYPKGPNVATKAGKAQWAFLQNALYTEDMG